MVSPMTGTLPLAEITEEPTAAAQKAKKISVQIVNKMVSFVNKIEGFLSSRILRPGLVQVYKLFGASLFRVPL